MRETAGHHHRIIAQQIPPFKRINRYSVVESLVVFDRIVETIFRGCVHPIVSWGERGCSADSL